MFLQAASLSLFLSAVWTHTHTNTHANTQKHNAQVSTRREESKHDQLGRQLRCGTQRSVVTFSEKRFHVQQKAVSSGDTFPVKDAYAMELEGNISPVVLGVGVTFHRQEKFGLAWLR